MTGEQAALALGLSSLHETYLARLRPQVAELDALARAIRSGVYGAEEVEGVRMRAHRMAGTAATFGFAALGDAALKVDTALLRTKGQLTADQIALVSALLMAARKAVGSPAEMTAAID